MLRQPRLFRWLNFEDTLINRNPWTAQEDKSLLLFVQEKGISNWIDIAASLRTNRTPFQCLARYQRSLNVSILKREWTKNEDAKLRSAVEAFGESDWQSVASVLEGWTGTQCSNRWKKSLHPTREKVGRWTADEDKRLKVAQLLFGPRNWKKTAQFVPGRTEVQCRERWVNSLDPSLSWDKWTEEEDSKLRTAIAEHGYCWAKIAAAFPRRTDNMCRRRWKRLLPDEVSLLQAERRIQKAAFIGNFVDRESERPALCPSDFGPLPMITSNENVNHSKKQTGKLRQAKKRDLKKSRENAQTEPKEVLEITNTSNYGEVETFDGHKAITRQSSHKSNLRKPKAATERKKRSHKPRSKRTELTENDERECVLLQPERLNLTSDGDWTEPLGEIDTTLTKTGRAPSKKQYTKTRRSCSKRQCSRNSTSNSGEHQRSALSSGKLLARGIATDVTLRADHSSCLDSTELMVINDEETGTLGSDKMASEENTGIKHQRSALSSGKSLVRGIATDVTLQHDGSSCLDLRELMVINDEEIGTLKSDQMASGENTGTKHQCSALSSWKSLVRGIATDITLQHDGSSCLDSTELVVINDEETGTLGSDKMAPEENTGIKQYRRRNKGCDVTLESGKEIGTLKNDKMASGENTGIKHQCSALSSGKSLVRGIATDVTLQHDGSSCLDSTELVVINNEETGTLGSDKMASEEDTGIKQYHRRNKGCEPAGLQDVVPVPSQHKRLKKLKSRGILCSDQNLVTANEDVPLACLKKRKVEVNDCGSTQACLPLIIQKESEIFPLSVDTYQAGSLMPSSTQDDELTCCDDIAFDKSASCHVESDLLIDISTVVASDNEPDRSNLAGGQKVACEVAAKEMASIDVESGHDAEDISLASLAQKKWKMERRTSKSSTEACPSAGLIRGSRLLSKSVNQRHDRNNTAVSDCEPRELDLVSGQEVALDEPKREKAEDDNEVGDITIASLLRNRSRKKRRLQSAK